MNLGFDWRSGLDAIPRGLEALTARLNTVWGKEHNPETGAHTDVTATSMVVVDPLTPDPNTTPAIFNPIQFPKLRLNVGETAGDLAAGGDVIKLGPVRLPGVPNALFYTYLRASEPGAGGGSNIVGDLTIDGEVGITGNVVLGGAVTSVQGSLVVAINLTVGPGVTTLIGLLDLSTAGLAGRIAFPAVQVPSADPNTLDDYEEGAWTPALLFGGAAVGLTYTARSGTYVKVGQQVTVAFRIELSAKGASAGAATVTGLPFTAISATPQPSFTNTPIAVTLAGLTSPPTMRLSGNTAIIDLFDWSATGVVALDDTNFANTSILAGSITYRAAA